METSKVSSAEVSKNFGQYADKALVSPVTITKHGREHLVLLSADEYARLKRRDRQVYRAKDVPDDILRAIEVTEPPPESEAVERALLAKSR
jgi:prevent-host-death family protein